MCGKEKRFRICGLSKIGWDNYGFGFMHITFFIMLQIGSHNLQVRSTKIFFLYASTQSIESRPLMFFESILTCSHTSSIIILSKLFPFSSISVILFNKIDIIWSMVLHRYIIVTFFLIAGQEYLNWDIGLLWKPQNNNWGENYFSSWQATIEVVNVKQILVPLKKFVISWNARF